MRIKLDGELFREEEMEELVQELEKRGVDLQTVKKGRAGRKGIMDGAEVISLIAVIADVFLPIVVEVVYNYAKKHKKENALIEIENREPYFCYKGIGYLLQEREKCTDMSRSWSVWNQQRNIGRAKT